MMIVFLDKNVARKQTNVNIKTVTEVEIVLEIKNVVVENVSQFAVQDFHVQMGLDAEIQDVTQHVRELEIAFL